MKDVLSDSCQAHSKSMKITVLGPTTETNHPSIHALYLVPKTGPKFSQSDILLIRYWRDLRCAHGNPYSSSHV